MTVITLKPSRVCDHLANTLIVDENKNFHGFYPKSILFLSLLLAYPVAIHTAVISCHPAAALMILLAVPAFLAASSLTGRLLATLAAAAIVSLLSLITGNIEQLVLYMMPVLINTGLAMFFGLTLLPGKTALITRISNLFRGKPEPRAVSYTRTVTQLWTLFFIFLATESLFLALLAPIEIWSLFTNILNYIFAALFFTGEYFFRIHYLDDLKHPSFPQFVRNLSQVNLSELNK